MTNYQRNKKFRRDLPGYRFALRKWMWRGAKSMTKAVFRRWEMVRRVETTIAEWQLKENFITSFFIEPPDELVKNVLSIDK